MLCGMVTMSAVAIDILLPALPAIAAAMASDSGTVQLVVSVYIAGYGIGNMLWGPVSDRFGRVPVLRLTVVAFVLFTLAAAAASRLDVLVIARALQGLFGAASPVMARAIVRDVVDKEQGAAMLALLAGVLAFVPLLAPSLGGGLIHFFGWRSPLLFSALFGALVGLGAFLSLQETNRSLDRQALSPDQLRRNFARFLSLPECRFGMWLLSLSFGGFLVFIAGCSPLLIEVYGVSPELFGVLFGVAAAFLVVGSFVNRWLLARHSMAVVLRRGVYVIAVAGVLLAGLAFMAQVPLALLWLAVTAYVFGLALVGPNATMTAMQPIGDIAGFGTSVLGLAQIGVGALAATAAAMAYAGDHRTLTTGMGVMGLTSALYYWRSK